MTPQDRLAAALPDDVAVWERPITRRQIAADILSADPTIAADMELGRRIRDAGDPLLGKALDYISDEITEADIARLRAALTEGEAVSPAGETA